MRCSADVGSEGVGSGVGVRSCRYLQRHLRAYRWCCDGSEATELDGVVTQGLAEEFLCTFLDGDDVANARANRIAREVTAIAVALREELQGE